MVKDLTQKQAPALLINLYIISKCHNGNMEKIGVTIIIAGKLLLMLQIK